MKSEDLCCLERWRTDGSNRTQDSSSNTELWSMRGMNCTMSRLSKTKSTSFGQKLYQTHRTKWPWISTMTKRTAMNRISSMVQETDNHFLTITSKTSHQSRVVSSISKHSTIESNLYSQSSYSCHSIKRPKASKQIQDSSSTRLIWQTIKNYRHPLSGGISTRLRINVKAVYHWQDTLLCNHKAASHRTL